MYIIPLNFKLGEIVEFSASPDKAGMKLMCIRKHWPMHPKDEDIAPEYYFRPATPEEIARYKP